MLKEKTGKNIEVMIYGDGAFKDPVGKIWELADPVVSPAYTPGLDGTPNEVKLKYLADNNFADLRGEELKQAISEFINNKDADLVGSMEAQGTTPRRLTDLIGSLSDLTSGSGDKGTPIVFIQGYFDNYTNIIMYIKISNARFLLALLILILYVRLYVPLNLTVRIFQLILQYKHP